jgi:hypothetical protein
MPWIPPIGPCRLCGNVGPLTKEHIPAKGGMPPGAARVEVRDADQYLEDRRGRIYQRGYHDSVFCEDCNRLTGSWYGAAYADWTRWGLGLLGAPRRSEEGVMPAHNGYPLRVCKQIIATMIAISGEGLTDLRPDLVAFVLDRTATLSPATVKLATYLCPSASGRSTGVAWAFGPERSHQLCEYSLVPFGYVLTLEGEPFDARPVDISWFAGCGYDEERVFSLPSIPVLPTHEAFPGDYRTRDEIRRDVIENILTEEGHSAPRQEADRIMAAGEGQAFFEAHGERWS